ncbi:MAG: M20/M25/M40 family metallo-hydrolase [Acidobacteriaceae bacterium]|nr:M20/M25/M40 family metallo-hydrolase [Acidobacteriaceae bacterium]
MLGCKFPRIVFTLFLSLVLVLSHAQILLDGASFADAGTLSPVVQTVLYSITASDLKGNLSFLASDALQGRYTPSFGLDVAAEFIASQFRAAGLEPGGDQDYFQIATMVDRRLPKMQSDMIVRGGSNALTIPAQSINVLDASQAAKIEDATVLVFPAKDPDLLKNVDITGKAILLAGPPASKAPRDPSAPGGRKARAFDKAVASSNAAIEIELVSQHQPAGDKLLALNEAQEHHIPVLTVVSDELQRWADHPDPASTATISVDIAMPEDHRVTLRNVVGVLRGSDPNLRDTCLLLSAHYDHLGTTETAGRLAVNRGTSPADHIYNGANDDGSGTVSVIEIARALAKLNPHPRRSVVFLAFFGEERGELGSQYYARHSIFPLSKTVADINLEQLGRTDATNGKHINDASFTGYDYSDIPKVFEGAGRETGIHVYMDKDASDLFFIRSDNAAFAEDGVPAHSVAVAFDFPDYHGLGDRWQKIDYENLARVDRMIALGLLTLANSAKAPEWNAQNPKTVPYREAQQRLRSKPSAYLVPQTLPGPQTVPGWFAAGWRYSARSAIAGSTFAALRAGR